MDQIKQQKKYIKSTLKIKIKVVALSNSKKMVFDESGLNLSIGILFERRTTNRADGLF